jgi:thiosulfate dehydrogenase [quinone] large subunit
MGWIALAVGGTGGLLVPRAVRELGTPSPDEGVAYAPGPGGGRPRGVAPQPEVSPGRRLVLQAGVLGALSLVVASIAVPLRSLRGDEGGQGLADRSSPAATPATGPGSSATAASPGAVGAPGASPFHPTGLAVASIANVDRKGAVAIRVPVDAPASLPAGDPAVIVRLPDGSYVAYDAVCTHEGCRVDWDAQDAVLLCPCHGAAFDPADHGAVLAGPTNTPLPELPIVVDKQAGTISLKA